MPKSTSDPFHPITTADLQDVSGGRMLTRTGPDPTIASMMVQLGESIKLVSASQEKAAAEKQNMTNSLMQQMMQRRG